MGFGPAGVVTGLFLPQGDFTHDTSLLPAYSHLFAVCHRCSENSLSVERLPDGYQSDSSLPSVGNIRVRPGTTLEKDVETKGRLVDLTSR